LRGRLDGQNAPPIGIFQAPGANALTDPRCGDRQDGRTATRFPPGVDLRSDYDTTVFVRDSIKAVVTTLLEATSAGGAGGDPVPADLARLDHPAARGAGVGGGHVRGAVPASAFSINTLTLFGLVLAIGIVVDDAIVVVENVERHIEDGASPLEAAHLAMKEVSGPIIAIALVLCAVFVPMAFLTGVTGQFYKQFAVTIAISTVISAINSLTLSPALAGQAAEGHGAPKDAPVAPDRPPVRLAVPAVQPLLQGAARTATRRGVARARSRARCSWSMRCCCWSARAG
jgi:multidrug efflux pump